MKRENKRVSKQSTYSFKVELELDFVVGTASKSQISHPSMPSSSSFPFLRYSHSQAALIINVYANRCIPREYNVIS